MPTGTYTGDLVNSALDRVRFYIGDTDVNAGTWLRDEEINGLLALNNNNDYLAAIAAAEAIANFAATKTRVTTRKTNDDRVDYADLYERFTDVANRLRREFVRLGGGIPYAGGISRADKKRQDEDPDRVKPRMRRNLMLEYEGTDIHHGESY